MQLHSTSSFSALFFVHSTKLQISTERRMPHHQQCESGGSTATTVVVKCCFVSIVSSLWIVPTANSVVVGCCRGGRTQQQQREIKSVEQLRKSTKIACWVCSGVKSSFFFMLRWVVSRLSQQFMQTTTKNCAAQLWVRNLIWFRLASFFFVLRRLAAMVQKCTHEIDVWCANNFTRFSNRGGKFSISR